VDQDDVLGVDQASGAGAGHRLPSQVGELAVRCELLRITGPVLLGLMLLALRSRVKR
jgi:hypothetical protein